MHALNIGPFAFSTGTALFLLGVIITLVVGAILGRKHNTPTVDAMWTSILIGLISARIVFVLHYLPQYLSDPPSIIDIRDQGFSLIGGLIGVTAYAAWRLHHQPALRKTLLPAVLTAVFCWGAIVGATSLIDHSRLTLPNITLTTLNGRTVNLQTLSAAHPDKPIVINLWATWCPPCRAEMPMLTAAQQQLPDVVFVFADQGESATTIRRFLQAESIAPANVLLDGNRELARATRSLVYPTTLFFNSNGTLVSRHVGMLSRATLARALNELAEDPASTGTRTQNKHGA